MLNLEWVYLIFARYRLSYFLLTMPKHASTKYGVVWFLEQPALQNLPSAGLVKTKLVDQLSAGVTPDCRARGLPFAVSSSPMHVTGDSRVAVR